MKTFLFVILTLIFCQSNSVAQKAKRSDTKIDLGVGPSFSLGWNMYSWLHRPTSHEVSKVSGFNRSAGQVLNIMPSCRLGLMFDFDISYIQNDLRWYDHFYLLIEGGIDYLPFAQDLEHYKGLGALSIPISISGQIPLGESTLLSLGAGVQFTGMEFNRKPTAYKDFANPFFVTYFGELGIGQGEYDGGILVDYQFFARLGVGAHQALTLNIGFRGRIALAA